MVIEFLIGLHTIDKVQNLAFIIRDKKLLGESLQDLRKDILYEIPELLPKQFGFIRKGVLVNKLPESPFNVSDIAEKRAQREYEHNLSWVISPSN